MAGNKGSGDQSDNSASSHQPTPQQGAVPVPGGNRSPPPPAPRLRMGLPGVSAFTPFTRTSPPQPQPQSALDEGSISSSSLAVSSLERQQQVTPTRHSLRMGVPGVSAFTPYIRNRVLTSPPSPPAQSQSQPQTAVASGSESPESLKRRLQGIANAGGAGVNEGVAAIEHRVRCSICRKEFTSGKSLFGHMRSHPERGWKGALPPPAFNASEEFADLGVHFQPPPAVPADQPAPPPEPEAPADASEVAGGVQCSICQKEFRTGRALIGHMRSHPPPTFNASEEFADLGLLFQAAPPPAVPDQPAPLLQAPEPEEPAPGDTGGGDEKKDEV